jgi:hypothetical protein
VGAGTCVALRWPISAETCCKQKILICVILVVRDCAFFYVCSVRVGDSSALNMVAVRSSETSVNTIQTTRRHIPEVGLTGGGGWWSCTMADVKTLTLDGNHYVCIMWCWRRMEKISWIDHVRNEEVLLRVNKQRNILHEIRKRKAKMDWSHFT